MNVFIFQSVPERYDLRQAIHPDKRDTWYATRYRNNRTAAPESRSSIIDAVNTPLGFLVPGFLVVGGTIASLAVALTQYQGPLVWTIIVSIPVFVLTVVALAVWRPEALRGDRPLQEVYANQFASDLFSSLDGALSNLKPIERAEAWLTVADVITSGSRADASYSKFCLTVAARLKQLTNVPNRALNTRGPIEP